MRLPAITLLLCAASAFAQDGAALYQSTCASCHNGGMDRAPSRDALHGMTAEQVLAAMETGPMISMASRRSAAERRAIAEFVSGKSLGTALSTTPSPRAMCPADRGAPPFSSAPAWIGWGANLSNTRFNKEAGLTPADV